jgi:hypothetical protein
MSGVEKIDRATPAPVAKVARSQRTAERRDVAKPRPGRREGKRPPPEPEGDPTAPHVDVLA